MRIGEAAARAGVSTATLRYYERHGLLPRPERGPNGYRVYTRSVVDRVRFVRHALDFGFSVKQTAGFLRARSAGRPPCREVRAAAERLMLEMAERIDRMIEARDSMRRTLDAWDGTLRSTPDGSPARLLETLDGSVRLRALDNERHIRRR